MHTSRVWFFSFGPSRNFLHSINFRLYQEFLFSIVFNWHWVWRCYLQIFILVTAVQGISLKVSCIAWNVGDTMQSVSSNSALYVHIPFDTHKHTTLRCSGHIHHTHILYRHNMYIANSYMYIHMHRHIYLAHARTHTFQTEFSLPAMSIELQYVEKLNMIRLRQRKQLCMSSQCHDEHTN